MATLLAETLAETPTTATPDITDMECNARFGEARMSDDALALDRPVLNILMLLLCVMARA